MTWIYIIFFFNGWLFFFFILFWKKKCHTENLSSCKGFWYRKVLGIDIVIVNSACEETLLLWGNDLTFVLFSLICIFFCFCSSFFFSFWLFNSVFSCYPSASVIDFQYTYRVQWNRTKTKVTDYKQRHYWIEFHDI